MDKTNLPSGILSRLDKLCPSLFINIILLIWGLFLEVTKDVEIGQVYLEISPFDSNRSNIQHIVKHSPKTYIKHSPKTF